MIIWIASYPKSGNTWIRSLLSSYLYSKDGLFNFDLLKKIEQFPSKKHLEFFTKDFTDIKKVSEHWISAQEKINLINRDIFMKTHSALCTLENNSFTDRSNTKAAIYIIRDPRNLVTSLSHHYSMTTEESLNFIADKNQMLVKDEWGGKNFGIATVLGDWSEHYKSWKNIKFAPIHIVKYEDLINNTKETFTLILKFLSNFTDILIDHKKINNAVLSCDFDVLTKKEKEKGFHEAAISKKTNKKLNFFYLGKKNNWKNILNEKDSTKVKKLFKSEMD